MYKILLCGTALLLAACTAARPVPKTDWAAVENQARAYQAACDQKRLFGELKGKVASVRCATPAILALNKRHNDPFFDLTEYERAQLLAISEREDRGLISEAQGIVEFRAVRARIADEQARRVAADKRVSAARDERYEEERKRYFAHEEANKAKRDAEEHDAREKEYQERVQRSRERAAQEELDRKKAEERERQRLAEIKVENDRREAAKRADDEKRRLLWELEVQRKKKEAAEEAERQRRRGY